MTKSKRSRRGGRKTSNGNPVDRMLVNSNKPTGSTTTIVESDLVARRQNFNIVQTPPKQVGNQIFWLRSTLSYQVNVPTTGGYTESNVSFQLSTLPNVSAMQAMFDQYCIYAVTVSIACTISTTSQTTVVHTALDYDNVASIGPTGITAFSSCETAALNPNDSIVRFVKPCVAGNLYGSGGFGFYSTQRLWVDMNSPTVQWYGVRAVFLAPNVAASFQITQNFVVGLRNSI